MHNPRLVTLRKVMIVLSAERAEAERWVAEGLLPIYCLKRTNPNDDTALQRMFNLDFVHSLAALVNAWRAKDESGSVSYHRDITIVAQFADHVRRGLAEASEPLPYVNPGRSKPIAPAPDTISRTEFDRAKHEHAVDRRLAEITLLKGVKRLQAIISLKSAWDQVSRSVIAGIAADQIEAAEQWDSMRRQRLAANRARLSKQRSEEALIAAQSVTIPEFRHLDLIRTKDGFQMVFETSERMTLKSDTRRGNLIYTARSRLRKHRYEFVETSGRIETLVPLDQYQKLLEVLGALDVELEERINSRLTPSEVEQILGINSRERLKWTKDKRLPTEGTDSFRKNGLTITFALHPFPAIAAITQDTVESWRQRDINATNTARSKGAKTALETRVRNDTTRKSVRNEIDKIAREASLYVRSPVAVPLVKLAFLSTVCSRWAKSRRDAEDHDGEAEYYDLKQRGLKVIYGQPWSSVRFVPAGEPRLDVTLCDRHKADFRDERRGYQIDFEDWIGFNADRVRNCRKCTFMEDHDYYALYEIRMTIGTADFCWHVPYGTGRGWLPSKKKLDNAPPRSDGDGIAIFGRPVDEKEAIVWKPKKLKEEMETLLGLFERADADREEV